MLKEKLKLVIITDLIFKNALDLQEEETFRYIGVIPLFMNLIQQTSEKAIVLTGEIIIIPLCLEDALYRISEAAGVLKDHIYVEALRFNFDYGKVEFVGSARKKAVSILTELFHRSDTGVLVGSNAYIGEGWDAPFVNTLIMASTISSYVSSNQIRGRAIRISPDDPEKCANIWHLVCMEENADGSLSMGNDFHLLKQRFQAFEGLYRDKDYIGRGIQRFSFPESLASEEELKQLNKEMILSAQNRQETTAHWERALKHYSHNSEIPVTSLAYPVVIEPLGTWKYKLRRLLGGAFHNPSLYLLWKGAPVYRIGKAILDTLIYMEMVRPEVSFSVSFLQGEIMIHLENALFREQRLFYNALGEMMRYPDNPRYLIIYKKKHYQVPETIGKNKKHVEFLAQKIWSSRRYKLLYTRTPEGRRKLLEIKLLRNGVEISWNHKSNTMDNPLNTHAALKVLKDELGKYTNSKK